MSFTTSICLSKMLKPTYEVKLQEGSLKANTGYRLDSVEMVCPWMGSFQAMERFEWVVGVSNSCKS
jgi:hypothetical protein